MVCDVHIGTGLAGLGLTIAAAVGGICLWWVNPPSGGIATLSDSQMIAGLLSGLLLLVGGIISIIGIMRRSGRAYGIVGVIVCLAIPTTLILSLAFQAPSEDYKAQVDLVVKLEVLSAKVLRKEEDSYISLISLKSTPIAGKALPVFPGHVRLLVVFAGGKSAEQQITDRLNQSHWDWQSSCTKSVPCGGEEISNIEWHIRTGHFCRTIKPAKPFSWKFDEVDVLTFPLATPKAVGTVAVCLIGMAGLNEIRLSEPAIVVLDPDKPDVSVTTRPERIPPERKAEMRHAAEKILDVIDCSVIERGALVWGERTKGGNSVKSLDLLTAVVESGSGPLSAQHAFRQLLHSTHVTELQFIFYPIKKEVVRKKNRMSLRLTFVVGRRLTWEKAVGSLGTPERTSRGIYLVYKRDRYGPESTAQRIPITWYQWAWLSAAFEEDGSCRELRIDTVARRQAKLAKSP